MIDNISPSMESVQAFVLLNSFMHGSDCLSVTDLNNLRKVNKEFRKELDNIGYRLSALRHTCSSFVNKGFETYNNFDEILSSSDIDIVELEVMLQKWKQLCNRRYGEKYGYLMKQRLICCYRLDQNVIDATLMILRVMHIYAEQMMLLQTHAPTDLTRYVMFWTSDYIDYVVSRRNQSIVCNIRLMDMEMVYKSIIINSTNPRDVYRFQEAVILMVSPNENFEPYTIDISDPIEFRQILSIWIEVYRYFCHFTNEEVKHRILLNIMNFTFNCISNLGMEKLEESGLTDIILSKASEFVNFIPDDSIGTLKKIKEVSFSIVASIMFA